ncbi:MAG TPA: hypothetical protein VGI55_19000 [Solirubrobacteraceae bacterium]
MKTAALAALVLAVLVSGASAAVVEPGVSLPVTPKTGHPRSTFRLRYTAPSKGFGNDTSASSITLSGPGGTGCVSSESVHEQVAGPGSEVLVALRPTGGRPWCVGTFQGQVEETLRPHCGPEQVCPMFIALLPVGHFKFVVRP